MKWQLILFIALALIGGILMYSMDTQKIEQESSSFEHPTLITRFAGEPIVRAEEGEKIWYGRNYLNYSDMIINTENTVRCSWYPARHERNNSKNCIFEVQAYDPRLGRVSSLRGTGDIGKYDDPTFAFNLSDPRIIVTLRGVEIRNLTWEASSEYEWVNRTLEERITTVDREGNEIELVNVTTIPERRFFNYLPYLPILKRELFRVDFYIHPDVSACGDLSTENEIYTLTQNVTSTGTCFRILANNITLDMQGFKVNYSNNGTIGFGVETTGYNFTKIMNGIIQQGSPTGANSNGIDMQRVHNVTVYNNTIITSGGNGRGIRMVIARNNSIVMNRFNSTGNDGDGINMGTGSNLNVIYNNTMHTTGTSSNGIDMSTASFNLVANNFIRTTVASTTGHGILLGTQVDGNRFSNNTIYATGAGISFGVAGTTPWTRNNTFIDNNITNTRAGAFALDFQNNPHNATFIDVALAAVGNADVRLTGARPIINFTNVSGMAMLDEHPNITWVSNTNGTLNTLWYVDFYANWTNGSNAIGVNITSFDVFGQLDETKLTNITGIARHTLLEYVRNGTAGAEFTYYSNYTINASVAGQNLTTSLNLSFNQKVVFTFTADAGNVTDSCTYPGSGNWDIKCYDNCSALTQNVDLANNNISFRGLGTFTINRVNITRAANVHIGNQCLVRVNSPGGIRNK